MAYKVLLVFATLVVFSAAVIRPGSCPQKTVMPSFEVDKYMGVWYEIQRYEQEFQLSLDCVRAIYSIPDPNVEQVSVYNIGTQIKPYDVFIANGIAVRSFPEDNTFAAKFNVSFHGQPPNRSNYWVLHTDYTSYSFVWSCEDLGNDTYNESAWILSRDNLVPDEFWTTVDLLLWVFDVESKDFRRTEQRPSACLPDIGPDPY